MARAVDVSGIEERDAGSEGRIDGLEGRSVVDVPPFTPGNRPHPETDDAEAVIPDRLPSGLNLCCCVMRSSSLVPHRGEDRCGKVVWPGELRPVPRSAGRRARRRRPGPAPRSTDCRQPCTPAADPSLNSHAIAVTGTSSLWHRWLEHLGVPSNAHRLQGMAIAMNLLPHAVVEIDEVLCLEHGPVRQWRSPMTSGNWSLMHTPSPRGTAWRTRPAQPDPGAHRRQHGRSRRRRCDQQERPAPAAPKTTTVITASTWSRRPITEQ